MLPTSALLGFRFIFRINTKKITTDIFSSFHCYKGVEASKRLAQNDLGRINKYKSKILSVAKQKKIDPSIIAGIMSRESRGGSVLKNGWGDHNNGFGLMQVLGTCLFMEHMKWCCHYSISLFIMVTVCYFHM